MLLSVLLLSGFSGSDAASHATASELCIYYYLGVSFKTGCLVYENLSP